MITLFADGALSIEKKNAGFGFWAKGDGRDSVQGGGPLPYSRKIQGSRSVELLALYRGVSTLRSIGYFDAQDTAIMLQSDSVMALSLLFARGSDVRVVNRPDSAPIPAARNMSGPDPATADEILQLCAGAKLRVLLRHVRGHQVGGGRTWVNNLCDNFAVTGRKSGIFLGVCAELAN